MKITRRENQQGTHRMSVSFSRATHEALRSASAKSGCSVAAAARKALEGAVAAGLLDADTPTSSQGAIVVRAALLEQYYQLVDKLQQTHEKQIEGLQERLDIKDLLFAQMKGALEEYTEVITEQATTICFYEQARVHDAGEGEK